MIPRHRHFVTLAALCLTLGACSSPLPRHAPALAGMEEPLALQSEPQDEDARQGLPAGSFSGVYEIGRAHV